MICLICEEAVDQLSDDGFCEDCYMLGKSAKSHAVTFNHDGTINYLGDDPLGLPLTRKKVKRFSHVVPTQPLKRVAFRVLRMVFGERGRVAEWTRQWHGPWIGIIVGSRRRFVHASRRVVIAWEHEQWFKPLVKL